MKKLYLLRHAKSSWDDPLLGDFDRPLNQRGLMDVPRMGRFLKESKVNIQLIISSPAVRALSTCQGITKQLDIPSDRIKTEKRLYHADPELLLALLTQVDEEFESVMIIGHNPGITEFANGLLSDNIVNIPTCGIVAGNLNIFRWADISWYCGKREFFYFPKMLTDNA